MNRWVVSAWKGYLGGLWPTAGIVGGGETLKHLSLEATGQLQLPGNIGQVPPISLLAPTAKGNRRETIKMKLLSLKNIKNLLRFFHKR